MKARATWLAVACIGAAGACRSAPAGPPPLPFELDLAFEGERAVDETRLEEVVRTELARLEVHEPDRASIDDAAFALEVLYRSLGHARVRIDYELLERPGAPPLARFEIEEGPVLRVLEFQIEGVQALGMERARSFFGAAARGGAYDEARLATGLEALRQEYLDLGYLRIAVQEPRVTIHEDDTVSIALELTEGPQFRVHAVDFEGGIPELASRERALTRQYTGRLFLPGIEREIGAVLKEDYQRRGHPDVALQAFAEPDESSGEVRLLLRVTPGERVVLAHFRIEGNVRTRDSAILSLLGLERGSVYDSEELRLAFRHLYATGLFESVQLSLEGSGAERTLAIRVVEARAVQVRVEPGLGSYEGPRVLLAIEDNNFLGRGQVVSLQGTASSLAKSARIGWIDRAFLDSTFTSETTFFVEQREEPSFSYVRRGFSFFVRRPWGDDWSSSFGYEFRPTEITADSLQAVPPDIQEDSDVATLSAALVLEDRDNPLMPTRGRRGRLRLDWAGSALGSDTEFLRLQLEYTHLLRMGSESVLAASARTGVIAPYGITDEIPLSERFFNGGENSVRSFREDELGPLDLSGDPVGGESATTLNLELRRPLYGNLDGAVFADAGNVTTDVQDYLDFPDFRYGLGVGLRYVLPIGPVRVDFAVNPDAGDAEDEYVFHFSVGFPF